MLRSIACVCQTGALVAAALADLPQLRLEAPQFVLPKRLARVSPDLRRIGPWIDYQGGIAGTRCSTEMAFDAFEPDVDDHDADGSTNDPGDGYYGVECGAGGDRFLFDTYCNPFSVDDMTVRPGAEGILTDRIEFVFQWNPLDPNQTTGLMAVFTTEEVSMTCTAPSAADTFPGVIYDFGDLPDGFWYTDVDLCVVGLNHEMPHDGQGGNILIAATEFTDTVVVLANCAQPGLWGTKHPDNIVPGTSPFFQDVVHWDDSRPTDFSHDPATECFSYALGFCPDPLGWAVVFYSGTEPCAGFLCGDANCDGTFDGADIDPFFLALGDPGAWQAKFPLCDRVCVADINGDGSMDGADVDAFFAALGNGTCP